MWGGQGFEKHIANTKKNLPDTEKKDLQDPEVPNTLQLLKINLLLNPHEIN